VPFQRIVQRHLQAPTHRRSHNARGDALEKASQPLGTGHLNERVPHRAVRWRVAEPETLHLHSSLQHVKRVPNRHLDRPSDTAGHELHGS